MNKSNKNNYNLITLPSGIRVIHRQVRHTEVIHVGLMLNVGSRDENPRNNGVAHFIEHSVFKGTEKRKSHHILRRLENVGGDLNAYTTREKTCFYASCLKTHAGRAVDLLTDITFHSIFPEKEIEKEKKVIVEEIDMYEDSPEESIYDDFYSLIFDGHPLGYNILGTKETVNNISRNTIKDFIAENYLSGRIALSVTGNIPPSQAERLAEKYLANLDVKPDQPNIRSAPKTVAPFDKQTGKDFVQAHCVIGSRAYSRHDDRRYALSILNSILGSSGMSSRLNMAVREKHGLTYHISSHYSTYQDAGVFSINFGCDDKNVDRCTELVYKELKKAREQVLTDRQLQQAKQQLLGQMAMVMENNAVHMQYQARSVLDYGKVLDFKEFMTKIEAVTPQQIADVANEIFAKGKTSRLVYRVEK